MTERHQFLESRPLRNAFVLMSDDEANADNPLIIDLNRGAVIKSNRIAFDILALANGTLSVRSIIEILSERCADQGRGRLENDVVAFLKKAASRSLVRLEATI